MDVALTKTRSETVTRELVDGLRRRLRARLASEHDAEDLAQEAWLRFVVERQRRDDIRNPRAYLQQIARNLLHHHYRHQARSNLDSSIDIDTVVVDEPGFGSILDDVQRLEKIRATWCELSPKCQQVLQLRWSEGLRVAEIAEHMSLSTGMIKKYLAQGLAHCRKRLGRLIDEDREAAALDKKGRQPPALPWSCVTFRVRESDRD